MMMVISLFGQHSPWFREHSALFREHLGWTHPRESASTHPIYCIKSKSWHTASSTFRAHSENVEWVDMPHGSFNKHTRNIQGPFREHGLSLHISWNILQKIEEHSRTIQGMLNESPSLKEHSRTARGTFREHWVSLHISWNIRGRFEEHLRHIQGTFSEHWVIWGTCRWAWREWSGRRAKRSASGRLCTPPSPSTAVSQHSVHIQCTFSEHSVHVQWTFSEHSVNIQCTFSAHSVNIQWTSEAFFSVCVNHRPHLRRSVNI
jgi:hypothetical protein